jgi:hypothetical protein
MLYKRRTSVFALTCFSVMSAYAAPDYRCTVERVASDATPSSREQKWQEDAYIGKQFTVERRTGIMAGALKNSYITTPQVIDYGSDVNSYKVVNTLRIEQGAGRGTNIYALTINEYKTSPQKPFVFLHDEYVFFGQCEHF